MKIVLIFTLLISTSSFAIDQKDVEKMVKEFEKSGIIPEEEGERVRRELSNLSPEQWKEIESVASEYQKKMNSPDVANDLPNAVHHVNTDSDSFKSISGDLDSIVKQRQKLLD